VRVSLALLLAALAATAAAEEPKPNAPKQPVEGWKREGFELSNPSADFKIRLAGYMQADFRSYLDWQVGDGSDDSLRYEEFEWRRLRIGIDGEWHRLSFEFDVDPAFDEGDELKNAWMGLRLSRALSLRGGHMKLPATQEFLISAAKTDFVERAALVTSLGTARDWGGLVEGELGKALEYSLGVFEGDNRTNHRRAETTGVGRLVLKPAPWLDLGGSYSRGDVVADPDGPGFDTTPKGLDGTSGTGYRFFPGVYVNGRRQRWGADARLQDGSVALWGEFLEAREERKGQGPTLEDLPDVRGRGWSVTGTWLVTGERKTRTIRPRRALFEGVGAVELAARYEELWFDDVSNEGFEAAGSRSRNIRPAGLKTFTGSVSWWPTRFLRFQANVLVERYDDALRAPEPGKQGNYVSLVGRAQVHLP
jgi:phosphate-selective porin